METVVECVNCGSGGDLQAWISAAGLVVAAVALLMNAVQFREFVQQLRARAQFEVTLTSASAGDDGVHRTQGERCATRVELGIKNTGRKAAGETLINVLVPREVEALRWCGPEGQELGDPDLPFTASEVLVGSDGVEHECQYIVMTIPRIGTKPSYVYYFQFTVELPEHLEFVFPVRAKVQAEEIPDEVDEYVADLQVRVERVAGSGSRDMG